MNANVNVKTKINRAAQVSRNDQLSVISVHSFDQENIAGLFSNNLYGKELPFGNLMSMLLIIEDCMNSISWPQQMVRYRKLDNISDLNYKKKAFRGKEEFTIPEMNVPKEWLETTPLATFEIRILFRTVSGWQGMVKCRETGKTKTFISDLELIMFMIDVLRNETV